VQGRRGAVEDAGDVARAVGDEQGRDGRRAAERLVDLARADDDAARGRGGEERAVGGDDFRAQRVAHRRMLVGRPSLEHADDAAGGLRRRIAAFRTAAAAERGARLDEQERGAVDAAGVEQLARLFQADADRHDALIGDVARDEGQGVALQTVEHRLDPASSR
jgi:hypothetical protein